MVNKQIIIDGVGVYKCENAKRSIFGIDVECRLGGDCSQKPNCYYKQLKRKEQECEELKEKIKAYNEVYSNHDVLNERNKYKQTLTEIKEIAETISLPMGTGKSSNRVILAKQILQKISECEVENEN